MTEIPKYITKPNEDFSGLDAQCNIAEKKLTPEQGLYVLDLKSQENISQKIEEKDFSEKNKEYFEHIFSIPENNKNCINILDKYLA